MVPKKPEARNHRSCSPVGACQNHNPNGAKHTAPTTLCHRTTTSGRSRPETTLAMRLEPAISGTAIIIMTMPGFIATRPGRTITSMPKKPTPTAAQRRQCGERQPGDRLVPQAVAWRVEQAAQAMEFHVAGAHAARSGAPQHVGRDERNARQPAAPRDEKRRHFAHQLLGRDVEAVEE